MKKYFILTLAIAGLALVSCQKEKLIGSTEAQVNEIALKSATVSTKSAIDGTAFPNGYGMLVSAYRNKETNTSVADGDESKNYFSGIKFKVGSNNTWVADTPKYWPLNGTLDFLCIASAGIADDSKGVAPTCVWGEASNVAKKVVATVPDNSDEFDDILYGSVQAQRYVAGGTPITFNHAECAVVFFAKSNIAYDATTNVGITITDITVNSPKTSGTLTVTEPKAGAATSTAAINAVWDLSSGITTPALKARVWNSGNTGMKADEDPLTSLDLGTVYSDDGANAASPSTLSTKKFGDAYVILPPQNAVKFTISYTLHNGYEFDGVTKLDSKLKYTYTPKTDIDPGTDGDQPETWGMGKKVIYLINITLHEIEIKPVIVDWLNDFRTVNIPETN